MHAAAFPSDYCLSTAACLFTGIIKEPDKKRPAYPVILGKNPYDYPNPASLHPKTNIKMEKKERLSFEEALSKLEIIISKLEDPAVSLEESISLYEEGMKLTKLCSETLEEAELKIRKVNPNKTEA